jgi:hypothetical protein
LQSGSGHFIVPVPLHWKQTLVFSGTVEEFADFEQDTPASRRIPEQVAKMRNSFIILSCPVIGRRGRSLSFRYEAVPHFQLPESGLGKKPHHRRTRPGCDFLEFGHDTGQIVLFDLNLSLQPGLRVLTSASLKIKQDFYGENL